MKKGVVAVLAAFLFIAFLPVVGRADEETFQAYLIRFDPYVFADGQWDAYAGCGFTNDAGVTYRWCGKFGRDGSYVELDDNERYRGTHTAHFSFLTSDAYAYGTDWENIRFACKLTYKGKTAYTEDVNMTIAPSSALSRALKDADVALTAFYPNNINSDAERFSVPAGERLDFSYRSSPVDSNLLTNLTYSDMELRKVVKVTENGKTTVYNASGGYMPYAVGKGAVTARCEYWVYAMGEPYLLADSKDIVLDTYTDPPVGSGKARYDCSLLKEMYTQSAKVDASKAVVAKGQWVSLLQQNGSWWKVSYNRFVGWIPATALDISTVVEQVSLVLPEPTDGANPSFSPDILEGAVSLFPTEPVTWAVVENNGSSFVYGSYRFQSGKKYRLSVWLKAANGYRFPLKNGSPNVTVYVNGTPATVRTAYEQDPEEVLEATVEYTGHIHSLSKVTQVNPTCLTDGKLTYYHCSCGADFEDYQGKTRITDPSWGIIPARGHLESEWMTTGAEHYKICQRRECMQEIAGSRGAHTGGQATCYAAAVCSVCGHEYGNKAPHVPGPAATEEQPQSCLTCGIILQPKLEPAPTETTKASSETETNATAEPQTTQASSETPHDGSTEAPVTSEPSASAEAPPETDPSVSPGSTSSPSEDDGSLTIKLTPTEFLLCVILMFALFFVILPGIVILVIVLVKKRKRE